MDMSTLSEEQKGAIWNAVGAREQVRIELRKVAIPAGVGLMVALIMIAIPSPFAWLTVYMWCCVISLALLAILQIVMAGVFWRQYLLSKKVALCLGCSPEDVSFDEAVSKIILPGLRKQNWDIKRSSPCL